MTATSTSWGSRSANFRFGGGRAWRGHLGGGTPTWLSIPQIERLFQLLDARFDRTDAEVSVEIDPDATSDAQLDALLGLGLTRISIGIQSFDDRVLQAINRPQDPVRVATLLRSARDRGLRGLNFDLVYGLPHQDLASLDATLATVVAHRPDRIALYSFAHLPWAKTHQMKIDAGTLPSPVEKAQLYLRGFGQLTGAGYVPIGMDHFALPDDELALAAQSGGLHRNFMGYTTRADLGIVGLGVSAISELDGLYAQQLGRLGPWYRALRAGSDSVERGLLLTEDDRLRRKAIRELMCHLRIDAATLGAFPEVNQPLADYAALGLGVWTSQGFCLTGAGRFAMRQVATLFDNRLGTEAVPFSRAL